MMSFFHKKDSAKKANTSATAGSSSAGNTSHINDDLDSLSSCSSTYSGQPSVCTSAPLAQLQHSSSSSLDSATQSQSAAGVKSNPVVAAKPKKGILKTMSKVNIFMVLVFD